MNFIHPTAIIEDSVELGFDNYIGPYCYIDKNVKIGNSNVFEPFCSIGGSAEHKDYFGKCGHLKIGNNCFFKNYVSIDVGTEKTTEIKDDVLIFSNSHISHDNVIENNVVISSNVTTGGRVYIMKCANVGMGAIIHQYSVIGSYSMLGMGSIVSKKSKIEPGLIYFGNPAYPKRKNTIALNKYNIDTGKIMLERERWLKLNQKVRM